MKLWVFYTVAIGFLLGVAVQFWYQLALPTIGLVGLVAVGVLLVLGRGGGATAPRRLVLLASVGVLALTLGLLRTELAIQPSDQSLVLATLVGSEVIYTGVVVREPDVRARTQYLYTKVDDEVILVSTERYRAVAYGDQITFTGELTLPDAFETDLGRTFNYPGYLQAQGVTYLVPFADVVVVSSGYGNPVVATLLSGKHHFMATLETLIAEPYVGLAEGLLLGVKRALGEELTATFRKTGIIHIVVLSGYNVAIVVTFVMYLLAYLLPFRGRAIVGFLAIIAFALTVGLSATVVRACSMASLLLLAQMTGRVYLIMRALLLVGVGMVALNPAILLYDPGFQLSFLATLGLIVGAPWLQARLGFVPAAIGVREYLTATLVTQMFVLPLLLYQIGEFSLVAVVVNVLVLPMVPIAMLLTFLTGLVGMLSITLAQPLAYLTTFSLAYIIEVATWFGALPLAAFVVPAFPAWVMVLGYVSLAGLVWVLVQRSTVRSTGSWTIEEEAVLTAARNESAATK